MFKKLKQKISEEQVSSKSSPSTGNRIRTTSFTDQNDEGISTPDKEGIEVAHCHMRATAMA